MTEGVHGEIHVTDPSVCRVSEASAETSVESVSRSVAADNDTAAVEFTAPSSAAIDDADEVFHHEQKTIYRVTSGPAEGPRCACELVECHGCPVRHLEAECGTVVLSFVASDLTSFRDIVVNLKSEFDGISLRRLTQSEPDSVSSSLVFVDRDKLTARQREVLETAHEMGYFDHPREANATEVAAALDINRSTFTEHLSAAQSKLLDAILDV
ncbi:transcriptional regulator NarO [Haloferax sp. KTX1]|uniref:transcriptional regulator NarO n=1 Tax=Haloferax sp. KTX1 TaxID=2600597 RepID=UPI0011DE593F|nr:transcriptional regulator NarO [Haloferax sp. KTX1]